MVNEEPRKKGIKPTQILALSFLTVIILGAILLSLPQATKSGQHLSLIDAFFTATSATCVTGLTVVNTGNNFSFWGQMVILALIQIGGLGIMTMSVLFVLLIGRKITLKEKLVVQESLNHSTLEGIIVLLKYILILTFTVEGIGAFLLWFKWKQSPLISQPIFYAFFHSVSAFCNAGFSLFKESLIGYRGDISINIIITLLIIIGGLGFAVVSNLQGAKFLSVPARWFLPAQAGGRSRQERKGKLTLHTKLVLSISLSLIVGGMVFFFLLENNNTLDNLPLKEKMLVSYFQAVTSRTAGFNTIPVVRMSNATIFFMIFLMFVGASPGSTGGGIKTSTFGILIAFVGAMFKGKSEVTLFKKTLPKEIVQKVLTIFLISFGLLIFFTLLLLITEKKPFIKIFFETVSAFGTVGLSMGITSSLSLAGKIILIITMYVGRIGPLALAIGIRQREYPPTYKYPEERVMVG